MSEKGDAISASQSATEQMDAESADMLAALRRQIQPHLMMAALTPARISSGHPPPPAAYSIPLPSYMIHVSYPLSYTRVDKYKILLYLCILYL